ncbi:MAG: hypothetical protein LBS50_00380 [Prevotellaceae bacterium]|jgi:hypothetical protein|nr:hypothetical protein [Prevotellaceae bacterium]
MLKINIIGKEKQAEIPSNWQELTSEQIIFIYKEYFYLLKHGNFPLFYDRLLCKFMPQCKKKVVFFKDNKHVNASEIANIIFAYLWTYDGKNLHFTYNEIQNHLPKFSVNNKNFYGPKDLLFDLTFEEFQAALTAQNEFFDGDKTAIDKFLYSLYRCSDKGKRAEYNPDFPTEKLKIYKKIHEWQAAMIMHWFSNCINYIQKGDIVVNGKTVNFSCLFPKKVEEEKKKNTLGWQSIIFDFAKDGIFGNVRQTEKQKLFDILILMLDYYNKNEEMKKEYAKLNSKHKK